MGNLHAAQALGTVVVTTAETVIGVIGPFSENQGVPLGGAGDLRGLQPASGPGAQGVLLNTFITATIGTGGTAVVLRARINTIAGATIPNNLSLAAVAGGFVAGPEWFDPQISYPFGVTYVITAQVTGATANSTFNCIVTAESANSFE